MKNPTFGEEKKLWRAGYRAIAGVDEVGRGSLAGPVVAAAVLLPADFSVPGVRDSKQLSPRARSRLFHVITDRAIAWGVGATDAARIDSSGIVPATHSAMRQALARLPCAPDMVLVDGRDVPMGVRGQAIVRGDALVMSIAAASIIAKVWRDHLMTEWHRHHPHYGFAQHKGYGTAMHYAAIRKHGMCALHRRSFLKNML